MTAKPVHDWMLINLDGEYGGDAPMTFVDLKQHIEFFANTDEIPDKAYSDETTEMRQVEKNFVKGVDKLPDKE